MPLKALKVLQGRGHHWQHGREVQSLDSCVSWATLWGKLSAGAETRPGDASCCSALLCNLVSISTCIAAGAEFPWQGGVWRGLQWFWWGDHPPIKLLQLGR